MTIVLNKELYNPKNYPQAGQHIIAQTNENLIVVYQAYKNSIAEYAVKNQKLGGPYIVSIGCHGSSQTSCG